MQIQMQRYAQITNTNTRTNHKRHAPYLVRLAGTELCSQPIQTTPPQATPDSKQPNNNAAVMIAARKKAEKTRIQF